MDMDIWDCSYYSCDKYTLRLLSEAADNEKRRKERKRETKYQTDAFYNFRRQKKQMTKIRT